MSGDDIDEDLRPHWSMRIDEHQLLATKPARVRLGFAIQLKIFQQHGRFPVDAPVGPEAGIAHVAAQLDRSPRELPDYDWSGRTGRRHRSEILSFLGFRRMNRADKRDLRNWVAAAIRQSGGSIGETVDHTFLWCRDRKIFAPSRNEIARLVRSVRQSVIDDMLATVAEAISPSATASMEASLSDSDGRTGFNALKGLRGSFFSLVR